VGINGCRIAFELRIFPVLSINGHDGVHHGFGVAAAAPDRLAERSDDNLLR
jgi:hypothetical protein